MFVCSSRTIRRLREAASAERSIGLWRDETNVIWIVEFSPDLDIDQIEIVKVRRFRFR